MVTARVPRPEGLHVSVSSVRLLNECPRSWFYKYMLGVERQDLPARMILGSACHQAIAAYYLALMTGEPPALGELVAVAVKEIKKTVSGPIPIWYEDDREVDGLVAEAERVLTAFVASSYVPYRVLGVEQRFEVPVAHPTTGEWLGYEEQILGFFDLVAEDQRGDLILIDHKIRRRAEPEGEFDLQLAVYKYAARMTYGMDRPIHLSHQNIIATTKKVKIEIHELPISGQEEVEAVETAAVGLEYIGLAVQHRHPERLMGRRRGWWCGGCGYRTRCATGAR
jgi:hypothetical protein